MVNISPHQIPTFADKNLFSNNVEWSSKYLWKMMSADVKTKIKQEIKNPVLILQIFIGSTFKKLEIQCKKGVFFMDSFDIGIPLILILSIKMVLFSISINLEPVSSNLEPVSIWPEVCSYIIGYIYNNIQGLL